MTNFHVVENAIEIRVRKHGDSKRYIAKVLVTAPDMDLALVTVEDETFWESLEPVTFNRDLPSLQTQVHVVGFPAGGQTICVTEGVVSRIDCKNYRLGLTNSNNGGALLVIQIDAAINGGNSGGPVFDRNGKVVGVAFQGMGGDVQVPLIDNYLTLILELDPDPNSDPAYRTLDISFRLSSRSISSTASPNSMGSTLAIPLYPSNIPFWRIKA